MKLYLAGPEVFLDDARDIGRRKVELCTLYGFTGLYPLDNGLAPGLPGASRRIFEANVRMMRAAEAVIANLSPFRGVSADAGTVFELGFCFALGKVVIGYSGTPENLVVRTRRAIGAGQHQAAPLADGMHVEDFDLPDNLMLAEAAILGGYPILVPEAPVADPWRDLNLFEAALAALKSQTFPRAARQGDGNG